MAAADISDVEDSNLLGGADKSSSDDNDLFDPYNWGGKNVIICGFVLGRISFLVNIYVSFFEAASNFENIPLNRSQNIVSQIGFI